MTNTNLLATAKQFLDGKDFFIDWMYNKRTNTDDKVICFTIDDIPDYIRVDRFEVMISPAV